MKKSLLLLVVLPFMAVAGFAQESRQDISVSGSVILSPYVSANAVRLHATPGYGGLISYRYMLTPSSALELNYQYSQLTQHYLVPTNNILIHSRVQEISGAYVHSFTFRNFNPFLEAGVGGYIFTPIKTDATNFMDTNQNTNIGALYGGGIAYELSPSFDIRVEYRGIIVKAPSYNVPGDITRTNRYYNLNNPVIGVAYHF